MRCACAGIVMVFLTLSFSLATPVQVPVIMRHNDNKLTEIFCLRVVLLLLHSALPFDVFRSRTKNIFLACAGLNFFFFL